VYVYKYRLRYVTYSPALAPLFPKNGLSKYSLNPSIYFGGTVLLRLLSRIVLSVVFLSTFLLSTDIFFIKLVHSYICALFSPSSFNVLSFYVWFSQLIDKCLPQATYIGYKRKISNVHSLYCVLWPGDS